MILQNHILDYNLNNKKFFIGRLSGNETIKNAQNNYWTNVFKEDMPKNPKLCENSSYW